MSTLNLPGFGGRWPKVWPSDISQKDSLLLNRRKATCGCLSHCGCPSGRRQRRRLVLWRGYFRGERRWRTSGVRLRAIPYYPYTETGFKGWTPARVGFTGVEPTALCHRLSPAPSPRLPPLATIMIKAILIFNNHGKPRLSKFYEHYVSSKMISLTAVCFDIVLSLLRGVWGGKSVANVTPWVDHVFIH